jgi:hypothetical protein
MILGVNSAHNGCWAQFPESIRETIGRWMRSRADVPLALRPYEIVRATVAAGMGFVSSDSSEKLIGEFFRELLASPTGGFLDTAEPNSTPGRYDASGLFRLLLLRETLQRHANANVRERRLPALRSCMMHYLRMAPFLLQGDGSGWTYGDPAGCLGTVGNCTAIVCALADGWLDGDQRERYVALLCRYFQNFFFRHLDRESGDLLWEEGGEIPSGFGRAETAFAIVRQLALWYSFGKNVKDPFPGPAVAQIASGGRYFSFSSGGKWDHGLMVYGDGESGLSFQLPLVSPPRTVPTLSSAAFPRCSGIVRAVGDLPPLLPILTMEGKSIAPSFGGKSIATSLGISKEFQFRYEQPDLFALDGEAVPGLASCKVQWNFQGNRIRTEFNCTPKKVVRLERFYFAVPAPRRRETCPSPAPLWLGEGGWNPRILQDDFCGDWQPQHPGAQSEEDRPLCYVRLLPILLQPGRSYRFAISFELDIVREMP